MHLEGTQEVREVVLKVYAGVPMCMFWAVVEASWHGRLFPSIGFLQTSFWLNLKSRIENMVLSLPLLLLLLLVHRLHFENLPRLRPGGLRRGGFL